MSWSHALAIVVLFASSAAAKTARSVDFQPPVHVLVAVCGGEQVPSASLAEAIQIAGGAYRDIGVTIDWLVDGCDENRLAIFLFSSRDAGMDTPAFTLGFAEPGTSVAVVLYDRIEKFARKYHVSRDAVLGYAMAHELGHLLLPPNSHSIAGLMRPSLNMELAEARRLRFTREQGQMIVRRLTATVATN